VEKRGLRKQHGREEMRKRWRAEEFEHGKGLFCMPFQMYTERERETEREKEKEGLHPHTYIHPGSRCRAGLSHTLYFFILSPAHAHMQDVFFSFPCPQVSISLPTVETASHFAVEGGPFYGQVLL